MKQSIANSILEEVKKSNWEKADADTSQIIEATVKRCLALIDEFAEDVDNGNIFGCPDYKRLADHISSGHISALLWEAETKIREEFGIEE